MGPPTKLQVFANFWPPKNVTTFYQPPYSPDLSPPYYFPFRKLKMKLKGLHLRTLLRHMNPYRMKAKKKGYFRQLFRNRMAARKIVYMQTELILN
jgi:hypothetical protein